MIKSNASRVTGRLLLVTALAGSIGLLLFWFDWYQYLSVEMVTQVTAQFGSLAPFLYIAAYIVATVGFIPGTALTLLGGVLFGPWLGTLYTIVGASAGAAIAFMIARFIRGPVGQSRSTHRYATLLEHYDTRLAKNGFLTVLILRLVPLFPFNALNYGLGFTRVRGRDYMVATTIGIIPGTFAYTYFGSSLAMLMWWQVALAVLLMLGLTLVGRYATTYLHRTM